MLVPKSALAIDEIGNSKSSCDQFMASSYSKNCKININVNK